jgi:hypothetical protein
VWYYIVWDFINVDLVCDITDDKIISGDFLIYTNYNNLKLKTSFYALFFKNSFLTIDTLYYLIKSFRYGIDISFFKSRVDYRLTDTNHGFYFAFTSNNRPLYFYKNLLFSGLNYLWSGLKFWVLALAVFLITFYYLLVLRLLPFNKIVFEWVCLFMFSY